MAAAGFWLQPAANLPYPEPWPVWAWFRQPRWEGKPGLERKGHAPAMPLMPTARGNALHYFLPAPTTAVHVHLLK